MGVIGKGSSSFRKKDVMEQKGIALGFKKIRFAHKATAGDTGINMNALVQPSEMAAYGFTNPTLTAIAGANLYTNRSNLKLMSSIKGLLIDQLSYTVNSSTRINFIDFTAEDGEIFTGWIDDSPTTSLSVVDGNQIVASGILLAGQTDFNIGTPIQINKNSASQIGAVMVFADRGLQYRKVGNITTGDGDYIEVPVAGGLGSLIRFNASGSDRFITVVSNGVVAERPDGSMMAAIERTQGQIDAMVPYLAAATGQPTSTFQTAPNNVDLKQFGDLVIQNVSDIASLDTRLDVVEADLAASQVNTLSTINTTSGTSFDINNVPSWAKRITISFNNVSNNGVAHLLVQLGTASAFATTGYNSNVSNSGSGSTGSANITTGFVVWSQNAADVSCGVMTIMNNGGNLWTYGYNGGLTNGTNFYGTVAGGTISLSDTLTRLRLTTTAGATFDAGSVTVYYE